MTAALAAETEDDSDTPADAVRRLVAVEDAATMLRTGSMLTEFEDVTGQDPPVA